MLVSFSLVKDNFSNMIDIIELESEYLWTFKAREFNNYFTVLPIKGIIDNDTCIKDTYQKDRMLDTYNQILKRNQVKEVIDYGRKENYVIRN